MSARIRWAPGSSWACRCNPVAAEDRSDHSILHATCVAHANRGLLIRGASGTGKSALALQLMALGAGLVADDRVQLSATPSGIIADAPDTIRGLIEARGLGLLKADAHGPVPVAYVLDLDRTEPDRLPQMRETLLLGQPVPLLFGVDTPQFAAALIQLLKCGRQDAP